MREILCDILQKEGESENILNNVLCFMIDRCVIEQKVNDILVRDIDYVVYFFKCFVYFFLQFFDVCIEEIFNIE